MCRRHDEGSSVVIQPVYSGFLEPINSSCYVMDFKPCQYYSTTIENISHSHSINGAEIVSSLESYLCDYFDIKDCINVCVV